MKFILVIILSFYFSNTNAQLTKKSLFDSCVNMRNKTINLLMNKMKLYLVNGNKFVSSSKELFVYKKVIKSKTLIKIINLSKVSKYDDVSMSGANLLKTSIVENTVKSEILKLPGSFSKTVFFVSEDDNDTPDFDFSLEEGLETQINKMLFSLITLNNLLNDKNEFYSIYNKLKNKELEDKNAPSKKETMEWLALKMKTYLSNNFTFVKYYNGLFVYKKINFNTPSITIHTIDLGKVQSFDQFSMKGGNIFKSQYYVNFKGINQLQNDIKKNPNKQGNYYNSINYSNGNGYMSSTGDIDINQESGLQIRFQKALQKLIVFNTKDITKEKY